MLDPQKKTYRLLIPEPVSNYPVGFKRAVPPKDYPAVLGSASSFSQQRQVPLPCPDEHSDTKIKQFGNEDCVVLFPAAAPCAVHKAVVPYFLMCLRIYKKKLSKTLALVTKLQSEVRKLLNKAHFTA